MTARLATPGTDRATATVSTRRSGSSRTARTMRSRRTSRSSVAFSRRPGRKLAKITTKSKTFHPLRKKRRGENPSAANRMNSSTTNAPRITSLAVWSWSPIVLSIESYVSRPSVIALTKITPSISGSNQRESTMRRQARVMGARWWPRARALHTGSQLDLSIARSTTGRGRRRPIRTAGPRRAASARASLGPCASTVPAPPPRPSLPPAAPPSSTRSTPSTGATPARTRSPRSTARSPFRQPRRWWSARRSTPPPFRRDAAPHGRGGRADVGVGVDLDRGDPLDPLKAAVARHHEAARRAVPVAERLAAHMRREQQIARVGEREAPAVAGDRDHADVRAVARDAGVVEQRAEPHAAPALRRGEAAGAVERRDELVAAVELGRRERAAAGLEAVRRHV